jgi:hypothetical protein
METRFSPLPPSPNMHSVQLGEAGASPVLSSLPAESAVPASFPVAIRAIVHPPRPPTWSDKLEATMGPVNLFPRTYVCRRDLCTRFDELVVVGPVAGTRLLFATAQQFAVSGLCCERANYAQNPFTIKTNI